MSKTPSGVRRVLERIPGLEDIPGLDYIPGLRRPRPAPRPAQARLYSPRLLEALGQFRAHPVTFGNCATLYSRGRDAYASMLDAIDAAKDHVNLETYIFQADSIGKRFAEALARKAAQGVVVNLTVDAVGCWGTPDEFFEDLEARGVHVLVFSPVRPWRMRHARLGLNHRDHRKILVVDGRVGFTGGMNIGDEYDTGVGNSGRWLDTHVRIVGPAVEYLQRAFMALRWRLFGEDVPAADYFPDLEEAGEHAVRILPTTPLLGRPYVRIVFRRAIHAAERSIHATQAYFMPDARVLWSLRAAAKSGVAIELVVPSESDVPYALNAGRSTYGRLMAAGVRIHERLGTVLHSKSVVVDGEWSILGSANMDIRSFRINHEVSMDVLGRDFAERLEDVFRADLERSRPVDPVAWARRPLFQKLKERACGFLRALT